MGTVAFSDEHSASTLSLGSNSDRSLSFGVPTRDPRPVISIGQGVQPKENPYRNAPDDRFKLVYIAFVLNGGAIYLAWILINLLSPSYYFNYWFSEGGKLHIPTQYAQKFMDALGMDACSPLWAFTLINIIPIIGLPQLFRVAGSLLVNIVMILILLITACTKTPTLKEQESFYNLTFTVLLMTMAANGVYQSSLFGIAADFPPQYSNALIIGTNAGGVLASLLYVFCTAANPKTPNPTAVTYFSVTFAYLILCAASLVLLWFSDFFRYFVKRGNEERNEQSYSMNTVKLFFVDIGTVFQKAWIELANIFVLFFMYYAVYPALAIGIQPWPTPGMAHLPKYYLQIGTFLNYYTMATVGAIAASFIWVPKSNKMLRYLLAVPVGLSLLFIPFFMYCNFIPNPPDHRAAKVVFKNEWFFLIANGLMGIVVGYISAVLMMLVPRVVPPSSARMAAQMGTFAMITGLYFGAGMTPVFVNAIE